MNEELLEKIMFSSDLMITEEKIASDFGYDLLLKKICSSESVGYKYIQTNIYTEVYNANGLLGGIVCSDSIEEIIEIGGE